MHDVMENMPFIMGCHITGIYDVNRGTTLVSDDFLIVKRWADSIAKLSLKAILFHNNLSPATCKAHQNKYLHFINIVHNNQYSPNVYRYFVYRHFIKDHLNTETPFFITDVTDVVAGSNPFTHPLFIGNPTALFCGDEPKTLEEPWMNLHSAHFRKQVPGFADYEEKFKKETLLNCGIIGGNGGLMKNLIEKLCSVHERYNKNNSTAYTGDMAAFNFLARTEFNKQVHHGEPVNTVFKAYQQNRTDCWFQHK
jgi:hypothetical protein